MALKSMAEFERARDDFRITTDRAAIDVDAVHAYIARSYWAESIPREIVTKAIDGSLCFALLHGAAQVGFARVVTDRATFAYLCDVYVLENYQGRGLGKWLIRELLTHPDLQGLRRFMLATKDAHGLYEPFSFAPPKFPETILEILRPGLYKR
jgi:GNAT superfamily N-acetyltransferase